MTTTNHVFSRSISSRLPALRRRARLRLESLESRRVLTTTISGSVIHDLDRDGVIDAGEPGMDEVRVYADTNGNGVLDISGGFVEPDDFAPGELIDGSSIGATFSVVDRDNQPLENGAPVQSNIDPFASTGNQVFAWGDVEIWHDSARLRIDFASPVSDVSINFTGGHDFFSQVGVLQAYDAAGNPVALDETGGLINGQFETLRVERAEADIAYVVAHSKRLSGVEGRLDALRVNSGSSELWTVSGPTGQYRLNVPAGGTYQVREVVPSGFEQSVPGGDGSIEVTVAENETANDVNFANREVASVAPVAQDDTAETAEDTPVIVNVLQNDSDDTGLDATSVAVVTQPGNGTVSINATTGEITYTPSAGFSGTDSFTYTVADVDGNVSNAATVAVTVTEAGGTWQNQRDPLDINDDGTVVPFDALLIINELNMPQYRDPTTSQLPPAPDPVPFYFDVNGDGFVTPFDAIQVINFLNAQIAAAAVPAAVPAVAPLPSAPVDALFAAALDQDEMGPKRK